MKHTIILISLLLLNQYDTEEYLHVKNIEVQTLFYTSIDFVTTPFIGKRKNFFLELEVYNYSSDQTSFEYRLSQRYYIEQLEKVYDFYYFRSNGIVISVCPNDSAFLRRQMFKISDSLNQLQSNLFTYENFVNYTANWAFYQVRYQNDTLQGTINFQNPIPFHWMEIPE